MKREIDIFIKGGQILDGTGSEPFIGDIGISGDKIAFIKRVTIFGNRKGEIKAKKVVNAKNLIVTPGFIDAHAHSDLTLIADPSAEGKVSQGITTEVNGNCGFSAAPLVKEAFEKREEDIKELDICERWSTFLEYFDILEKRNISLNFVTLVGHGNLRACVTGYKNKTLTSSEKEQMHKFLIQSLQGGAIGISTGLIYPPGIYSDTEELIELCNTLYRYYKNYTYKNIQFPKGKNLQLHINQDQFGIYTSHMRSEGDHLLEALEEAFKIGKMSGVNIHISHIKTNDARNWHKIDNVISLIEEARKRGMRITCDRYPYIKSSTDLDTVLPAWVYEGGSEQEVKRIKNVKFRKKIKEVLLKKQPDGNYWGMVRIAQVSSEKNKWMEGKSIASIAQKIGTHPIDMLFKILIDEKLKVDAIFSSMNEENLRRFLMLSYTMLGTDSSARSTKGITRKGKPHPRGFGSYPRFLGRYMRDAGIMSISEAVHKITMLPAQTFGIHKRGILKKGGYADVVVFDYKKIIDKATFDRPFLKPEGIYFVFVNGIPTLWEGKITNLKAGRILRRGG